MSCDNGDWITVFAELEWEWAPNRCSTCKVFGHSESVCTRKVNQASALPGKSSSEDEWTEVTKRKKGKEVVADPPVLSGCLFPCNTPQPISQTAVHDFRLTICLWVVCTAEL